MKIKMLLIILSGGGDTFVTLAPATAKDWIEAPLSTDKSSWSEKIPEAVMKGFEDQYEETEVQVTVGSGDNDRAMAVKGHEFGSVREAMQFAAKNNMVVVGEYYGCVY